MKISTKGRYALRMLVYLAVHQDKSFISLAEIAEAEHISKKYLEQIVPLLTKAGLLRANRGNRGGYLLAKPPQSCTVGDVLRATEGNLAPVACLSLPENTCPHVSDCRTLYVWEGLHSAITDYLDGITLQDIAAHGVDEYCI